VLAVQCTHFQLILFAELYNVINEDLRKSKFVKGWYFFGFCDCKVFEGVKVLL